MSADPQGTAAIIKSLWPVPADLAASMDNISRYSAAAPQYAAAAASFPAGDEYRANPLVDDIRRSRPALYAVAAAEAPPPSLFNSGDLPVYTASGVEPATLARLPWQARHAVASAPTTAEAYQIIEAVSGEDGDILAHLYGDHPGVRQYENRVRTWAMGPSGLSKADRQQIYQADAEAMTEELFRDLYPPGTTG
jgi:hypothetical protein